MNADMSVTTRQQISAQQRMRRLKNKIFLSAYRKGDEMTPEEEERGHQLQLARVKKKEMQRERYRRTAEDERKLKNVIRERFAEEERKLKNVCLTVTRTRAISRHRETSHCMHRPAGARTRVRTTRSSKRALSWSIT